MGRPAIDLTGQRFGKLVALERVPCPDNIKGNLIHWRCQCDCGKSHITSATNLRFQGTYSCGCERKMKHGMSHTPEHDTWLSMKARCTNNKLPGYKDYGGRGIEVCAEWFDSFEQFFKDMGLKPSPKHSIERVDNDLGYCAGNCVWALSKVQSRNKRSNIPLTVNNVTKTLGEWSEICGLPYGTLYYRIKRGWNAEEAVNSPVGCVRTGEPQPTIAVDGVSMRLYAWSEVSGLKLSVIYDRIRRGWTPEEAITIPALMRRSQYYRQKEATNGKATS